MKRLWFGLGPYMAIGVLIFALAGCEVIDNTIAGQIGRRPTASTGSSLGVTWPFQYPFQQVPTGSQANSAMVSTDINGDGLPDVISGNNATVSVNRGSSTGLGSYSEFALTPGSIAVHIAVGDVNNDGKKDIVTANSNGSVDVVLGNGAGSFALLGNYILGLAEYPTSLTLADLNGDGYLDAVFGAWTSHFAILLGTSTGALGAPLYVNYGTAVSNPTVAIRAGDFDEDGKADIAVAYSETIMLAFFPFTTIVTANSLDIYLGDGAGNVVLANQYVPNPALVATLLEVSDLNSDGHLDLVVASNSYGFVFGGPGTVDVLLGNGDGTFGAAANTPTTNSIDHFALTDLNADGVQDVFGISSASSRIFIALSQGDGTFSSYQEKNYFNTTGFFRVAGGDFDGNGKVDVAVASWDKRVTYMKGKGNGTFDEYSGSFLTSLTSPNSMTLADFNADGKLDLLLTANGTCRFFAGDGLGGMGATTDSAIGYNSYYPTVGDFNNDGKLDFAAINSGSIRVHLGDGAGGFANTSSTGVTDFLNFFTVGDLNSDGNLDVVASRNSGDQIFVLLGNGNGTLQAAVTYNTGGGNGTHRFVLSDFDGDGKLDVVIENNFAPQIRFIKGNGDGTLGAVQQSPLGGKAVDFIHAADFNHDGKLDIAFNDPGNLDLNIMSGNGDGTFGLPVAYTTGELYNQNDFTITDINGDGLLDVMVDPWGSSIWYFEGKSDGTFKSPEAYAQPAPNGFQMGDLNGDGKPDLIYFTGSGAFLLPHY